MFKNSKLSKVALAIAIAGGVSMSAVAQETASSVSGTIVSSAGDIVSGATITMTDTRTGSTKVVTSNASGGYNLRGLRVGGPYTVSVKDAAGERTVGDVYLTLGEELSLDIGLEAAESVETIQVTASQISSLAFGKQSAAATFDASTLQNAPAINRDITDIIRIDPRLYVDEGGNNGIQCAGKSPRFNSLTVDGVRQNDLFGLNSNGYPTERMPFPFDAIDQVAVELAPFDVIYGGFTACNINAVTKSGSNEIHGSVFFDYTNDSMRGDSLEGDSVTLGDFSEERMGFTLGAPLIKDKLFIFTAYEKLEGANLFDRGPIGSGAVNEVSVTQAQLDEIAQISRDLYQYDPGPIPSSLDNEDEKLLVKLDWNINEAHRLALTYDWNDGNNFTQSDGDSNEFEFQNHLYERGAELTSIVGSLYSDWTDNFSTELRIISQELDNRQISLEGDGTIGGNDFGEIRIDTGDVNVYIGGDDSRQANDLDWEQFGIVARGTYYMDNGHTLTFGYEMDDLDVFNVFVQHVDTEIRFNSIDDFRAGLAGAIYYNNAPSGDPTDAAAVWGYKTHALYFQDEFYLTDDLLVTAGVRYDWYTTDDAPQENPEFTASYGFSNSTNLDGEGLIQPRIGFNYTMTDATEIRGGVGLYSGGNPNVWLSNNFSNNNVLQFGARGRSYCYTSRLDRAVIDCNGTQRSLFDDDVVYAQVEDGAPAGPGYGVPQELADAVATGSGANFDLNYLDPNFKIPSEWKIVAGFTHVTDNDWVFDGDVIVSITQDAAIVKRGDLEEVGVTADGYIDYDSVRLPSLVLTNSDEDSTSINISGSVNKAWENGFEMTAGYSYSDAEDVQPMTSAVAFSNYQFRAFTNPNEEVSSTSDWNIEHRLTLDLRYEAEWISGYPTRFSAFGVAQSGRPYSFVLEDSNAVFGFTPFLEDGNVLPIGASRNSEESSWWTKVDIAIRQSIPTFHKDHTADVSFVIDNFTNMLNDDWGILEEVSFNTGFVGDTSPESRVGDASLWQMRVGVNYRF